MGNIDSSQTQSYHREGDDGLAMSSRDLQLVKDKSGPSCKPERSYQVNWVNETSFAPHNWNREGVVDSQVRVTAVFLLGTSQSRILGTGIPHMKIVLRRNASYINTRAMSDASEIFLWSPFGRRWIIVTMIPIRAVLVHRPMIERNGRRLERRNLPDCDRVNQIRSPSEERLD